jgi:hypothetical protein
LLAQIIVKFTRDAPPFFILNVQQRRQLLKLQSSQLNHSSRLIKF